MKIKPISLEKHVFEDTCDVLTGSRERIKALYDEMVEKNEELGMELDGDVKTCFSRASEAVELDVKKTYIIMRSVSNGIADYIEDAFKDEAEADIKAGGRRRE